LRYPVVEVPGQTVTVEVVKEVQVPGETVVVEKEVLKTVEVPGQTVVVEKEVVRTVEVPAMSEEDRYGGTLRWSPESSLNSLRLFVTGVYIKGGFIDVVYDRLLAWNGAAESKPQMLDSWIADEGNTRFLFKLRDDMTFHDGHPVTTEDVLASLERWMVGDPAGRLNKKTLASMGAIDERTLELNFSKPNGTLIYYLGPSGVNPILKKEISDITEKDADPAETIGSGPGRLVEFTIDDKQVIERFEGYVPRNEPQDVGAGGKIMYFDKIVGINIPDQETRYAALETGEIDMAQRRGERFLHRLKNNPDIQIMLAGPGAQWGFYLNMAGPLANGPKGSQVRQAFSVGIDPLAIMEAWAGSTETVTLCGSFFPCGTWMANEEIGKSWYNVQDIERARKMIQDTGYAGEEVIILDPSNNSQQHDGNLVFQEYLKAMGLNLTVNFSDGRSWGDMQISPCAERDYATEWGTEEAPWHISNMAFGSTHFQPINNPFARMGPGGPKDEAGRGCWVNEEYQLLVQELATTVGQKAQKAVLDRMQEVMWEDPFYFTIGLSPHVHAFNANIRGVQPLAVGMPYQIGAYWADAARR
jgi:peptide/nickel transport system substrate-binding protein